MSSLVPNLQVLILLYMISLTCFIVLPKTRRSQEISIFILYRMLSCDTSLPYFLSRNDRSALFPLDT